MKLPAALGAAVLVLALPLATGCGASTPAAEKRARIEKDLQQLETSLIQGNTELRRLRASGNVLGLLTLYSTKPPAGVGASEWKAAVDHNQAVQRLSHEQDALSRSLLHPGS